MTTTPENQRQEMDRIFDMFEANVDVADEGSFGSPPTRGEIEAAIEARKALVELAPKIIPYLRSLQAERDTLLREHGELRDFVAGHEPYCPQCSLSLPDPRDLIPRIPDRSVPPQA